MMDTLVSVLENLSKSGFESQFKATANGLLSLYSDKLFQADEVKVLHFYRFEGNSDPEDNAILYAIETISGERGTLVDAFGPSADSLVTLFMQSVQEIHK